MLQVYVLSVMCPALAGWMLFKNADEEFSFESVFSLSGKYSACRLGVGIASLVTGVLALLSPIEGDVPLAGDLVPALFSLAAGLSLCDEYFSRDSDTPRRGVFFELIARHRRFIGLGAMIAGALHFLLPRALFL
ncbi:MAG: hypothetical protein LBC72_04915 [Spirochaetaceae bacterium]|jgi:hypothetical protein|nr:hypothetical protein [Spirochaetaceae bacterium]